MSENQIEPDPIEIDVSYEVVCMLRNIERKDALTSERNAAGYVLFKMAILRIDGEIKTMVMFHCEAVHMHCGDKEDLEEYAESIEPLYFDWYDNLEYKYAVQEGVVSTDYGSPEIYEDLELAFEDEVILATNQKSW